MPCRPIALLAVLGLAACDNSRPAGMPLVRIGEGALRVISAGNEVLWGIRDVVDLNGTTWVLTTTAPHIHGFEPTGGLSARFGLNGAGPEELRFPWSVWAGPQPGTVTVWDPGSLAALTFSGHGQLLSSSRTSTLGVVRSDISMVTFGDPFRASKIPGAIVVARYASVVSHGGDLWRGRLFLVSDDGKDLALIIDFASGLLGAQQRANAWMLASVPLWDGCPDGRIAVLDPISRQLLMLSRTGRRLETIPLPWEPDALSDEARLAYLVARIRAEAGDRNITEAEILDHATETARRGGHLFPAEEPFAVDVKCSPGQVWIQEFDPSGHPLGYGPLWRTVALGPRPTVFSRVLFPADFSPFRISDSRAIGVVEDSLGFQRLAAVSLPLGLGPKKRYRSTVPMIPLSTKTTGESQP